MKPERHQDTFDRNLRHLFTDAFFLSCRTPAKAYRFLTLLVAQLRAASARKKWLKKGVAVPPLLIASLTSKCNLNCKGCYARASTGAHSHAHTEPELTTEEWINVLRDAQGLGISVAILAGGEPFLRTDLFEITRGFSKLIFPIFTNGLLLNDDLVKALKPASNIIPVISIEGDADATDDRRGDGISLKLEKTFQRLRENGIFFGVSITASRANFEMVTGTAFIDSVLRLGCGLFFFVEYVPMAPGTENLVLTPEQKEITRTLETDLRSRFHGLFVTFPGDEEQYGGCLAAGRGFVHINTRGGLEPCPFAPYSDVSLRKMPLREALQSSLLRKIRENHGQLKETQGGCALWANREWVRSVVEGHADVVTKLP